MRLRIGELKDLDLIYSIKCEALKHYKDLGISWNENYPTRDTFKSDIEKRELFVLEKNKNEILGIVVINRTEEKAYDDLPWTFNDDYVVLHRVLVNPAFSGKGYGKYLIQKVLEYAKEDGIKAIRLDTNTKNILGQKLYKSQGFNIVGEISLKDKEGSFYCLEKILE